MILLVIFSGKKTVSPSKTEAKMAWVGDLKPFSEFRNKKLKIVNIETTLKITNNVIITKVKRRPTTLGLATKVDWLET